MDSEANFSSLRQSAACAHLSREQITELLGITATRFDERKRIRQALERLPESLAEVHAVLNELTRIVR